MWMAYQILVPALNSLLDIFTKIWVQRHYFAITGASEPRMGKMLSVVSESWIVIEPCSAQV